MNNNLYRIIILMDKPKVKYKCFSIFGNTKYNDVFNDMSITSKNIYNTCVFHYNIYSLFKENIYNDFINTLDQNIKKIKKNMINKYVKDNYNIIFFQSYDKYYKLYCDNKDISKNNNNIIYNHIKQKLIGVILHSKNIEKYEKNIYNELTKICKYNETNKFFVFNFNFQKILKSFYNKTYFTTKKEMLNHEPLTFNDETLINDIKNDYYYFRTKNFSKKNLTNINKIKIKGDQGIFKSLILSNYLNENRKKLPSDVIGSIIDKFYANIKGYHKLIEKKNKANKPTFKTDYYNIIYTYRSFKQSINNIRLTIGEHIAKNYNNLMKQDLISLNNREYYRKNSIKSYKKDKNHIKVEENKYINKNDIVDGYYLFLEIPKKFRNKNIKQIDIKHINDKFKIFFSYDEPLDPKPVIIKRSLQANINNAISIDTGITNLLTIYNPNGYQRIFKGNKLKSINHFYNKKIDELKSINKKEHSIDKFKRLYSLLEERKYKLHGEINNIINKLLEIYKFKDIFIIGYNKLWKNKVNLGRDTNRTFYQIPYAYIIEKLRSKLSTLGKHLIVTEESYTSKCDALTLETINKKDKYNGKRIQRGLYLSGNGKVINADLNGAINIMRKALYKLHP